MKHFLTPTHQGVVIKLTQAPPSTTTSLPQQTALLGAVPASLHQTAVKPTETLRTVLLAYVVTQGARKQLGKVMSRVAQDCAATNQSTLVVMGHSVATPTVPRSTMQLANVVPTNVFSKVLPVMSRIRRVILDGVVGAVESTANLQPVNVVTFQSAAKRMACSQIRRHRVSVVAQHARKIQEFFATLN